MWHNKINFNRNIILYQSHRMRSFNDSTAGFNFPILTNLLLKFWALLKVLKPLKVFFCQSW